MNFEQSFLNEQIITYLGNKRKLIQFIDNSINKLIETDEELKNKSIKDITFFDIFSGSGIVSRYGKAKGFKVLANDLEIYSKTINESLLNTSPKEANIIFRKVIENINSCFGLNLSTKKDTYQTVIDYLNTLKKPKKEDSFYFSKHYAPKNTNNFNFDKERLFYTQENALIIDAIVEIIYDKKIFSQRAKNIILASLMYVMTRHINTSGTMKGFHNGWGGPTKTSLHRIMAEIQLKKLPLIDGESANVYQDYAEKVFINEKIGEVDIIYADPPYNQHQYSANYNHLITICKNDKYDPGEVKQGSRAGIRTDHNRSDFCKSIKNQENIRYAEKAFIDFINNIKCKYLVVSYNNEGILKIDKLLDILSNNYKNFIYVETQTYSKFKGGKNTKQVDSVIEYLLIVKMNVKQKYEDLDKLKKDLSKNEVKHLFLNKYINFANIESKFTIEFNKEIALIKKNNDFILKINKNSYKVIDENIDLLNKSEIDYFHNIELDKTQLIEKYIEDKNYLLAKKLLPSFNIKKLKDKQIFYSKLIEDMDSRNG